LTYESDAGREITPTWHPISPMWSQRHADRGDGRVWLLSKYMARRLLDLRHEVITLTNSPHRSNPFGESIKAFLYNFSEPKELEKSLRGIGILVNTYWVRRQAPALHFCAGARQHEGSV
jgi:hypothetical protein